MCVSVVYIYLCVRTQFVCRCMGLYAHREQRRKLRVVIHHSLSYSLETGLLTKSAVRLVTNKSKQFCLHHPSTEVVGSQAAAPCFLCESCHPNPGPHACISDTLFLHTELLNPIPRICFLKAYYCCCCYMCVHAYDCVHACGCVHTCGCQKRALDSLNWSFRQL